MVKKNDIKRAVGVIRKEDQATSRWAGGTTTQLMIYPENGDYGKREFIWRVSSAKVETDESIFTCLPGISRIIMVLEGSLKLVHEGHHSKELNPFETDKFLGDWITKSYGQVTDFNLMMADGVKGELEAIKVGANSIIVRAIKGEVDNIADLTLVYYSPFGNIRMAFGEEEIILNSGDVLYISGKAGETEAVFHNDYAEDVVLVYAEIVMKEY